MALDVRQELLDTLKPVLRQQAGLKSDARIEEDTEVDTLVTDSLDMSEMIMAIEEKLGIDFPEQRRGEEPKVVGDMLTIIIDQCHWKPAA